MKKIDLIRWVRSTDSAYLKRYTGVKTDKGLDRFRKAFQNFLECTVISESSSLRTDLAAFKEHLNK